MAKRVPVALGVCFALALSLRAVRRSSELTSSDAADLASDVTRLLCSNKPPSEVFERLLLFRLGGVQPFAVFSHGFIAQLFDVSLQPTNWEWSTILVSSASAPLAFLAGRRFGGPVSGLLWAVFVAVSPIHIMLGRSLGAPWAYELAFQLAILWLLDRHLGTDARSATGAPSGSISGWLLSGCLAVYMWCGNQMMAVFPVLGYSLLVYTLEQPKARRLAFLRSKVLRSWLLLPVTSGIALSYCTFVLNEGHLHHALFEKRKALGWYWNNAYSDLVRNIGYVPTWACLAALVCAVVAPRPVLDRRRVPLVYALCYFLPFLFLVSRSTTLTRGYSIYGLTGLLGLLSLAPHNLRALLDAFGARTVAVSARWTMYLAYGTLAAFLLAGTGAAAYHLYPSSRLLGVKGFQGSFGRQTGVAAAAAFVSTHSRKVGTLTGKVFSDAYGGMGLEPPIMRLYFRRRSLAKYDAARMTPWKEFGRQASHVDFAVIRPENAKLVGKYFPALGLAAKVSTEASSAPVLLVYARDFSGAPQSLRAEEGPRAYSQSVNGFCPNK